MILVTLDRVAEVGNSSPCSLHFDILPPDARGENLAQYVLVHSKNGLIDAGSIVECQMCPLRKCALPTPKTD